MAALDLLKARAKFLASARPSVSYCRENSIDWAATEEATGGLFLANVRPAGTQFKFDNNGPEAAIIEALDSYGSVIDLVAWSVRNPRRVLTAIGAVAVLGEAAARDPTTYSFDKPLRLFRTPLLWCQERCDGAVILDADRGARVLLDVAPPAIAAEDAEHAAEIHAARVRMLTHPPILLPTGPLVRHEAA